MLNHIHILPLAGESFGVRSMCTYVRTPNVKMLLDAGVSLCPKRFGLPPHPKEFEAIELCRRKIAEAAEKADVVTLSHYHFDHHTPSYEDWLCNWTEPTETANQIYGGKTVLVKNAREKINYSQRRRGWVFRKTGGQHSKKLETADGRTFYFGRVTVRFSEPVPHGVENSALGWVLMTAVEYEDEKFLFAPDVQGPMSSYTLKLILDEKPQLLMIGGPPLYLSGFKVDEKQIQKGLGNLKKIVEVVPCTILEHHVLRDEKWREKTESVFEKAAEAGNKVLTAAEFLGEENRFLEALRRSLYVAEPPSKDYEKWMRLPDSEKRLNKPLI
jgi:predicted metallo-beta-lactamase superfamily hydrolase